MAELVYAFDLKSNGEIHMGSSPISGTTLCYSARWKAGFVNVHRESRPKANNMVLWRSGYAAVCKTAYTGSIPVGTSIYIFNKM